MSFTRRSFIQNASIAGLSSSLLRDAPAQQSDVAREFETSSATSAIQGLSTASHRLRPVPIQDVVVEDTFWSPKRAVWQDVTIRDCFRKFESDRGGALNNFDKVRDGKLGGHAGDPWMDGLVYEMIRGASDFLIAHPDPELQKQLEGYCERIAAAAAKHPDGYVNTYTQLVEPGHEWGLHGGLQVWQHEIYNLGALVDAGVHFYAATGKTTLLVPAVKIANTMAAYMGPSPKKNLVPCHALPEEALIRLYELFRADPTLKARLPYPVKENDYLKLAEFWIENRGNNIGAPDWDKSRKEAEQFVRDQRYGDGRPSWGSYAQDDVPVFQQKGIEGHAVRATLLCTGLAAAAYVNDDPRYRESAVRLWESMVDRRMHITGGVGAFAEEEKFGPDYLLPNDAYLETCAAVGAAFFHRNMNLTFGHARYADELERVLYNGALSGVSLKGDTYLYENPLEAGPKRSRWVWHECPCCPPMFVKLMGAMPGYIYATDDDSIYVNLFVSSRTTVRTKQGTVKLSQTSEYPWKGDITLRVHEAPRQASNLMVRIPGWANNASLKVNGKTVSASRNVRGYARLSEPIKTGDVIELNLPMPVRQIRANPLVKADVGRAAVMRGPLVYCFESADNSCDVNQILLRPTSFAEVKEKELGGILALEADLAHASPMIGSSPLYSETGSQTLTMARVRAIPYFANLNRGPVNLTLWVPIQS